MRNLMFEGQIKILKTLAISKKLNVKLITSLPEKLAEKSFRNLTLKTQNSK